MLIRCILRALLALDLSISPPSPALLPIVPDLPPEIQLDVSMLVDSVLEGSESDTPISTSNSVLPVVQEEPETAGDVEMEASTDGTPTTSASPAPIRLPILPSSSAILQSSSSSTNSPLRQVIPVPLISPMAPPVASTSELPTTSNSPPNSSSSQNIKTSLEATVALSPIVVPEIALEYTNLLPIIPSDLFRQRLIIKRKGKEKEKNLGMNGGFDLWKLHVKAQHTGAKTFLGRGKRVHNILSTADYGVSHLLL